MRYENLLASRYIKAQRRQSFFTCVSIAAAVAVIAMIFILYSVCMNCLENTYYSNGQYHLIFSELTEEQGEAMANFEEVRSLQLYREEDGVSAYVLFGSDIGDREIWLMNAAKKIGAFDKYERSIHNSMHGAYEWNDNLMKMDGVYDGAHLVKLRIFCIFFIFAILIAFALRMIIDTAFEVSSKERERHYGVLQSIGATPEQIVRIITSEGLRLCVIAIPLGLIAGIGFAYLMYNVLLAAGLSDLFQGMTAAKLYLPFSVDWKMLLVTAVVGVVWVFLSAYGVGMRIIKKAPMEAIIARSDKVEKVRKRTLSGLLFGISGSIASRNARRQKKRFAITVLTLTVSITMFALFSTMTETIERSITEHAAALIMWGDSESEEGAANIDFQFEIGDPEKGSSCGEALEALSESGLFEHIAVSTNKNFQSADSEDTVSVCYMNREAYTRYFGADAPVSYDELVSSGGYVYNSACKDCAKYADQLQSGSLRLFSYCTTVPEGTDIANISYKELVKIWGQEKKEHTVDIIGSVSKEVKGFTRSNIGNDLLIGAFETHEKIAEDWFGLYLWFAYVDCSFVGSSADDYQYNAADMKKAEDWFREHPDVIPLAENDEHFFESSLYNIKWKTHSILATLRAGVLILNLLIALAALINLMNIISTGIANRRSELASLQCVGMTDKQLDRMAIIECLQFAGAAAIISAIICALIIIGTENGLQALINASFVDESEEARKMLKGLIHFDRVTPFIRIGAAALTAFAAGCVTSLVMLRMQNNESLSDQIRGSELKLDAKKSHILRNSILAVAGAFVLTIAGLRIFSVVSYHNDRNEYAKAGYLNLVDGKDTRINVYSTGVQNGKHTIVGLAGMGIEDYPVSTKALNERLGKENTVVYADRPGYGFSDDSCKKQTLEEVVENYRAGLKNAGFEAPYVLMPHSYASFYALWWQAKYPDEIEAIIFMDCTDVPKNEHWRTWTIDDYPSEAAAYADARKYRMRTWLGLDRLIDYYPESAEDQVDGSAILTQEQMHLHELTKRRAWTAANISEMMNEPKAAQELREILKPTDTPKLWFSSTPACEEDIRESMEFDQADHEAAGLQYKQDPETTAKAIWQSSKWFHQDYYENRLAPFLEQCGNCRLVRIGGYHHLFWAQKTDKVTAEIEQLLAEIQ